MGKFRKIKQQAKKEEKCKCHETQGDLLIMINRLTDILLTMRICGNFEGQRLPCTISCTMYMLNHIVHVHNTIGIIRTIVNSNTYFDFSDIFNGRASKCGYVRHKIRKHMKITREDKELMQEYVTKESF